MGMPSACIMLLCILNAAYGHFDLWWCRWYKAVNWMWITQRKTDPVSNKYDRISSLRKTKCHYQIIQLTLSEFVSQIVYCLEIKPNSTRDILYNSNEKQVVCSYAFTINIKDGDTIFYLHCIIMSNQKIMFMDWYMFWFSHSYWTMLI